MSFGDSDPRPRLGATARRLHRRGWMSGTAGNLSARLDDGSLWISASGKDKGRLRPRDFLRLAPGGEIVERGAEGDLPSAETAIHHAVYALFPEARACLHVHSVASNLAARMTDGDELPLPPLEMLKGLGVREEEPRVALAVFRNHAHVPAIAAEIAARFAAAPPRLPGLLVRDHGLTVWAADLEAAVHHLELLDYLFAYMIAARADGIDW
ncbi:MAG TPA: methylthioribulose 1-phosphate dehydratase [Thermoanaerobaculia bacterium]